MSIESSSVLSGLFTNLNPGLEKLPFTVGDSSQLAGLSGLLNGAQSGSESDPFSTALLQQMQLLSRPAATALPMVTAPLLTQEQMLTQAQVALPASAKTATLPVFTQDQTALPVLNESLASQTILQKLPEQFNYSGIAEKVNELLKQPEDMQEITLLLGKQLPVAKKQGKEINLDETMQALSEVLGRISNVVSDPVIPDIATVDQGNSFSGQPDQKLEANQPIDSSGANNTEAVQQIALSPLLAEHVLSVLPEQVSTVSAEAAIQSADTAIQDTALNLSGFSDINQSGLAGTAILKSSGGQADAANAGSALDQIGTQFGSIGQDLPVSKKTMADADLKSASVLKAADGNADNVSNTLFSLKDSNLNTKAMVDNLVLTGKNAAPLDQNRDNALARATGDMQQLGRQPGIPDKVEIPAMTKHLYSPEWSQDLGSKILWMNHQNIASADLKLNPQHLGPISIRIDMQQEQANISFTAQNAGVREMLEASIPKLREMLGSQQLNLVDVNVSQQSFTGHGQGQAQTQNFQQSDNGRRGADADFNGDAGSSVEAGINSVTDEIEQSRTLVTNGLVSLYA